MAKVNTLFSYFAKSQKTGNASGTSPDTPQSKSSNMPSKSATKSENGTGRKSKSIGKDTKNNNTPSGKRKLKDDDKLSYAPGDIVWAKLQGYPYWPSIVSIDESIGRHQNANEIHVLFFDNPPSRAWVNERFIKKYLGSDDSSIPKKNDKKWKKAIEMADKAFNQSEERRLSIMKKIENGNLEGLDQVMDEDERDESDDDKTTPEKEVNREPKSESSKKRRRIIIEGSDDSEDEYKPKHEIESDSDPDAEIIDENDSASPEKESDGETPVKRKRPTKSRKSQPKSQKKICLSPPDSKQNGSTSPKVEVSKNTLNKLASFASSEERVEGTSEGKVWAHLNYDFLKPGSIKDNKGRNESHPDFDPKTLFIPESFKKNFTPAHKQWWEMKSANFDVVLFFKVGKFYELYHMDAVIGVNELGLIFMKDNFAHSGFPEISYGRFSQILVEKGYRVARVEQTETPQMMEERCKQMHKPSKFDRVVRREICQISTKGARRCNFLDGQQSEMSSSYLLAVTEKSSEGTMGEGSEYGVCFIDTTVGKFYLGQFKDDRHRSRLRTLLAHYTTVQVLYEKGTVSSSTLQILKNYVNSSLIDCLTSEKEFWDAQKTLKFLREGDYFNCDTDESPTWPPVLKEFLDESDPLQLTAKDECQMAIRALGACTWYLQKCLLDQELLSVKENFIHYTPLDVDTNFSHKENVKAETRQNMILDGVTLSNLDIVENSISGGEKGTLIDILDNCRTPFGKRLLKQWVCAPLFNVSTICDRLSAISDLIENSSVVTDVIDLLKKLPDLERLLSKIHTQGCALRSKSHPDSRAIFYEDKIYSKRKIMDFLTALEGFRTSTKIIKQFEAVSSKLTSKILQQCVTCCNDSEIGKFPDLEELLEFFDNAFDHEMAKKEGKIVPSKGVDAEYDNAIKEIKECNSKAEKYLQEQQRVFGCKVSYFGTARNRFQIEVPDHATKHASQEYELQSQRKGFKRYWTDETKNLLNELTSAEESRDVALKDIMRRIFASFSEKYAKWDLACQCLAILDALISLTLYSQRDGMCRPDVLPADSSKAFIEIIDGRHPCMQDTASEDFIPNDVVVGRSAENNNDVNQEARLVLVTGPNMGGKSTLMRQTGILIIMAQMGCYVPAASCTFTAVDRLFTRIGASDKILSGESTFFVELSETSAILQHATENSFVVMDELGRGTATFDGCAIACAVVGELSQRIHCRTLFSTHYHTLVKEFCDDSNVKLGHMSCMVEDDNDNPTQETVTFLYKFEPGVCPKSYGFNVAKLAGISDEIVNMGYKKAKEFERGAQRIDIARRLSVLEDINDDAKTLLLAVKDCLEE